MPVLAVALLVTVGGAAAAPRAWAAPEPMSHCSTTTGVVMAVSFAHWGGPMLRSCASTPATAYGMLNQGGWQTTGTEHDGPGFICRIGYRGYQGGTQYPTPAQESCVLTPPSSAYWTFWHAGPGQDTWSYSQTGATGYSAAAGQRGAVGVRRHQPRRYQRLRGAHDQPREPAREQQGSGQRR